MREFVVGAVMLMSLFGVACDSTGNDQSSSSQESSDAEESAASEDTKTENAQQQSRSNASSICPSNCELPGNVQRSGRVLPRPSLPRFPEQ
jgi:hypothetical protein